MPVEHSGRLRRRREHSAAGEGLSEAHFVIHSARQNTFEQSAQVSEAGGE